MLLESCPWPQQNRCPCARRYICVLFCLEQNSPWTERQKVSIVHTKQLNERKGNTCLCYNRLIKVLIPKKGKPSVFCNKTTIRSVSKRPFVTILPLPRPNLKESIYTIQSYSREITKNANVLQRRGGKGRFCHSNLPIISFFIKEISYFTLYLFIASFNVVEYPLVLTYVISTINRHSRTSLFFSLEVNNTKSTARHWECYWETAKHSIPRTSLCMKT